MKILIFDLDDTLIDDQICSQWFKSCCKQISQIFKNQSSENFNQILKVNGRGKIFNIFLRIF